APSPYPAPPARCRLGAPPRDPRLASRARRRPGDRGGRLRCLWDPLRCRVGQGGLPRAPPGPRPVRRALACQATRRELAARPDGALRRLRAGHARGARAGAGAIRHQRRRDDDRRAPRRLGDARTVPRGARHAGPPARPAPGDPLQWQPGDACRRPRPQRPRGSFRRRPQRRRRAHLQARPARLRARARRARSPRRPYPLRLGQRLGRGRCQSVRFPGRLVQSRRPRRGNVWPRTRPRTPRARRRRRRAQAV
ncbi:MAG: Haloacid dehalogenase, type II, partial [uncultured Thermomicrobiales bacterium]